MARIDTASLFQKVMHRQRPFIIDDALWLVNQLVAKLGNQGLYRNFINGAVGWNTGNHVAKGDDFAQLGCDASQPVVQTPEEVDCVSHEGGRVVDWHGAPSHHANPGVLEGCAKTFYRANLRDNVRADQHHNLTIGLLEEEIDGGCLPLTLLLHAQTHSRFAQRDFRDNWNGPICTTTGNDYHFFEAERVALLLQYGPQSALNIGFFVIGHNTNAAPNPLIFFVLIHIVLSRWFGVDYLCCHSRLLLCQRSVIFSLATFSCNEKKIGVNILS